MIIRQPNRPVAVSVECLRDNRLSLAAKGAFAMLTAFSDEHDGFDIKDELCKAEMLPALIELVKYGYVHLREDIE